jgi:hypothetical protein
MMKQMPKVVMEDLLSIDGVDFLLSDPVFDFKASWQSLPFVFEKVMMHLNDGLRAHGFSFTGSHRKLPAMCTVSFHF